MKKSLRFGAAAIAAVATLSLASCGFGGSSGDSGGGDGSTTLDLLVPSYSDGTKANWETVIDGFEKANPDIKVKLEVQSWDNLEKVVSTKIQAGEAPDIYNGGPFAGFVGDELLYPVEDVVSEETYSDFQDSFLKNAEVDGTAYALPLIASARALFVNNALLDQAGVEAPTDWDSLLDAATKVSALGGGSPVTGCRSGPKRHRPRRPCGCGAAADRSEMRPRSRSTPRRTSWVPSRSRR
ncbi:ABC transporter substrate-binding protein [Microbacterium sp. CBA3102]|uniref:ABC transporter substrate-binding protein n=1 Tax=Microbacterium sp. CBA3102 TaxID=2603598 RepID=UPI002240C4C9|nr:extracellular solute-binding protein [Microbacterium sp. CBA3102]